MDNNQIERDLGVLCNAIEKGEYVALVRRLADDCSYVSDVGNWCKHGKEEVIKLLRYVKETTSHTYRTHRAIVKRKGDEGVRCIILESEDIGMESAMQLFYDGENKIQKIIVSNLIGIDYRIVGRSKNSRISELNNYLQNNIKQKYCFRLIGFWYERNQYVKAYSISFRNNGVSLELLADHFYELLKSKVQYREKVYIENKAFILESEKYKCIYVLEGYKDNSSFRHYVENGIPKKELLYRANCDCVTKLLHFHYHWWDFDKVNFMMGNREWINRYPNPGDRYVAICNYIKSIIRRGEM